MTSEEPEPAGDDGYELLVPFIVCTSAGGPFDDEAFVAGFACGQLDKLLETARAAGADQCSYQVRDSLIKQCELFAMNRGFMATWTYEDEIEGWSMMVFSRSAPTKCSVCGHVIGGDDLSELVRFADETDNGRVQIRHVDCYGVSGG